MSGSISCGASVTSTTRAGMVNSCSMPLALPVRSGPMRPSGRKCAAWRRPSTANVHAPAAQSPGRWEDRRARSHHLGKVEGARWQANRWVAGRRPTGATYEKYPLTAATAPSTPTPVAIGVNWYEDFDNPQ